jgi:hypothetical protein
MDDFLLLIHGLMKVALVIGVLVLVATAPSPAIAFGLQEEPSASADSSSAARIEAAGWEADERRSSSRCIPYVDDDDWMESSSYDHGMNLDGTPMNGDLDLNGNSFGDCGGPFDWGDT